MSKVRSTFVPDQDGGGLKLSNMKNNIVEIILKLASVDGYNAAREIRGSDGSFMPGTDVSLLAAYTVQPDRLVRGKSDFVKLLLQAGIPPAWIMNENMKIFLPSALPTPPPPPPPPPTPREQQLSPAVITPESTQEVTSESISESTPEYLPPLPRLTGPFHSKTTTDSHMIPLPETASRQPVKRRLRSDDNIAEKKQKHYHTIEDLDSDDD